MIQCAYEDCRAELPEMAGCQMCRRCQCGCGQYVKLITKTSTTQKRRKGFYNVFVRGHYSAINISTGSLKKRSGCPASYQCPFSGNRLHELYWQENMSPQEIANLATVLLESDAPISRAVVGRWLKEQRVEIKSLSEAKRSPNCLKASMRQIELMHSRVKSLVERGAFHPRNGNAKRLQTKSAIRKMAASKRRRVSVTCVRCGARVERRPCEAMDQSKVFCSRRCVCLANNERKRDEYLMRPLVSVPLRIPEWARENVERLRQLQQETE